VKSSRRNVRAKATATPELRFEDQRLTSFAGLVVIQKFFQTLALKSRLQKCFRQLSQGKIFDRATLFMQLVVHVLLGYRELRDAAHYRDDPLVQRVLGLKQLPDVATLSRMLKEADRSSVDKLRQLLTDLVLERIGALRLPRITLDFDGSVQSTKRRAEGSAVGFNKKKKGARSYYPLFCTLAQTGQVLDFLHRSGNVHDSNGAREFILQCVRQVRERLPGVAIEVRMDSAFFSDEIVTALAQQDIEYTISVPFERFVELKQMIEGRRRWTAIDEELSYFETQWKPKSWPRRCRFAMIRTRAKQQQKGPVQLDLFEPYEYGYEFKVIVTNKELTASNLVAYHSGRGSQEGVFGELKTQCQMDYIPVRTRCGNEMYLLASLFAYNLIRDLQMQLEPPTRTTNRKRSALWQFERVETFRRTVLQRAGRLSSPSGKLILTFCTGKNLKQRVLQIFEALAA
jgi:Transposase DDE domain group 1